ncbi:MAG: hypothetical protein RSD36_14015 [Terrisporobacter sp.]
MNIEITLLCTIAGAILGYMSYKKKTEKDIENDVSQKTLLSADVSYIRNTVNDIRIEFKELRVDIKAQDAKLNNAIERLIKVEESTKSAHHRIDNIKGDVTYEK